MALKNLVEPQCGEGNPLIKLSHHISKDKAHREDLLQHAALHEHYFNEHKENNAQEFVSEFLNENRSNGNIIPQTFDMGALFQEMQEIERRPINIEAAEIWEKEYLDSGVHIQEVPPVHNWAKEFLESEETYIDPEALWDEAIKNATAVESRSILDEDSEVAKAANEFIESVKDPKINDTEFMSYMHQLSSKNQEESEKWSDEFTNSFPKNVQWEKEFEFKKKNVDYNNYVARDKEFWENLQHTWEKAAAESKEGEHSWVNDFEADSINPFKDYVFQEENPLKNHPDPLAEGKKYREMGDLPSAILLFEAAAQKDPSNSEAWFLLGTSHAENEQDPSAISALKRALDIDPSNLDGWMSLATSYTNESYQNYACESLKEWIRNNEEYKHLIKDSETINRHPKLLMATLAPRELVDEVQGLYLKAVNLSREKFDLNAQCGLGILLNITGDYDKAIDCFQTAVNANPMDPKIWNKLGATLANSSRSAEAIDAYRRALELSPGFIRCRFNLGVACINLGAHREAVEHFLEALNMQQGRGGMHSKDSSLVVSDNIWSTLKICLRYLNAQHLIGAVHDRDLNRLNEEFGNKNHE